MDNSTQPNETLMKYLDGELNGAEKEEFEKKLAVDPVLQQEFEDLQMARAAVQRYGLKEEVASIHRQIMSARKRPIGRARRIARYSISIAASILLVVVGVIGYNFLRLSPDRLYNSQYHTYELSSMRGSEGQVSDLEKAYGRRDYKKVILDFQKVQNPGSEALFLSGIAYLEIADISAAITSFKSVIKKNKLEKTTSFGDEAEYYLALSYLRNKNYDQALDLMQAIRDNPGHLYHDQFSSGFIRKVKMLKWR